MKEHTTGISINGKQFHSIRFADDIALLADSEEEMSNLITDDNKSTKEIRRRITLAKHAFEKKRTLLTNKHLSIRSRKKFVWSILLYCCESWTIGKYEKDRLEAIEMWMWRKMTRTSWIEHKTNEEVLNEINEERTIMNTIMKRTIKLIGHLLRNNEFITIIMEGKIEGKRSRGRPRKSFFEEIFRRMGVTSYQNLKRTAFDRHVWLQQQGLAFRS
ncbi:Hypothetical protein CINCED_3A003125 [Cinara cedri]|uniref:Reverse transcriptase domain n=1 Tax=Cinara cedri TaxID=506608 RepID=A0A5E4NJ17_9HEMI|nr:Hypothetical protein CINCED_3A003125 [Cinara cedri]